MLGLCRDPVVLAVAKHAFQLRHDLPGVSVQDLRPLEARDSVAQTLRSWQVIVPGEAVIGLCVFDTAGGQLASEPLVPVEADLDQQREPGLHANVDENQIAIDEALSEVQAFALGRQRPSTYRDDLR